jgi:hypothetical protein
MKTLENIRKNEEMTCKIHSWGNSCKYLFIDDEMQYELHSYLSSLLRNSMFESQHSCNCLSIQQTKRWFLKAYMNVWMNVSNRKNMYKYMNNSMYQFLKSSLYDLEDSSLYQWIVPFKYQVISKLIKSIFYSSIFKF